MIEAKKEKWALFFYSFSLSRNFEEILFRSPKAIKDKKFEVFNGLKVQMLGWIILGHCYFVLAEYGYVTQNMKKNALDKFFSQIAISSDLPISMFYFMSAFIGMFGLLKKY